MIYINLTYNLNKDTFEVDTNAKNPKDLVSIFIQTQISKGEDNSKAEEHDEYKIRLDLDLTEDTFTSRHNCGNLGLRDGILLGYLNS